MRFIDIHTHNSRPCNNSIYNSGTTRTQGRIISTGIHPWYISNGWKEEFSCIAEIAAADNVAAIGECGFDTLRGTAPLDVQEKIFTAHAQLAEEVGKPLIIHCVKAYDTLLALRNTIKPQQEWIIHGFRGKPELALQLIKAGFHISLGEKFNPDSARAIPAVRLFIESDESQCPINDIYAAVATAKGMSIEELALQTEANARIFRQF